MVTGFIGGGRPIDYQFIDLYQVSAATNTDTNTHSVSFGAADPRRKIAVALAAVSAVENIEVSNVTIGGVAALRAVRAIAGATLANYEIWTANVPTGTSGNVVIKTQNIMTALGSFVFLYRVLYARNLAPTDTGVGTSTTSIDIKKGGLAIGISRRSAGISWTGLLKDDEIGAGGLSSASLLSLTGETGLSVGTSGGVAAALAVAAFR